jgi:hypothetical protein
MKPLPNGRGSDWQDRRGSDFLWRAGLCEFGVGEVSCGGEGGLDLGGVFSAGHGELGAAAAGATDEGGDGFDPVAGFEFVDEGVADAGEEVDLGREFVAVLVGVFEFGGEEGGDFLVGVLFLEPVPGVAEGVGGGVGDAGDEDEGVVDHFGAGEEGFGVEAEGGGLGALLLGEFFGAVLQIGDGGLGAALGDEGNIRPPYRFLEGGGEAGEGGVFGGLGLGDEAFDHLALGDGITRSGAGEGD